MIKTIVAILGPETILSLGKTGQKCFELIFFFTQVCMWLAVLRLRDPVGLISSLKRRSFL